MVETVTPSDIEMGIVAVGLGSPLTLVMFVRQIGQELITSDDYK